MSYYSNFEISVYDGDKEIGKKIDECSEEMQKIAIALEALAQLTGYDEFQIAENVVRWGINGTIFCDQYKWYECDDDMLALSKQFPNYLFVLDVHGEEWDDIWRSYYKNGESQFTRGKIVFDNCRL